MFVSYRKAAFGSLAPAQPSACQQCYKLYLGCMQSLHRQQHRSPWSGCAFSVCLPTESPQMHWDFRVLHQFITLGWAMVFRWACTAWVAPGTKPGLISSTSNLLKSWLEGLNGLSWYSQPVFLIKYYRVDSRWLGGAVGPQRAVPGRDGETQMRFRVTLPGARLCG